MKILFYVEPLIEQDMPYWKIGWVNIFCRDIIKTLKQCENNYEFLIMTNEAIAQKVDIEVSIVELTQKELLKPFGTTNYMDVTTAWHCDTYTTGQLKDYKKVMLERLDNYVPDIIISFSPVPFFRVMFPETLILHHEYSIFSRHPYPQTWFLDPIGMHSNLFLNKFQNEIKSMQLTKIQTDLLNGLKQLCQNILTLKSPFKKILQEKRKRFNYLVLLPLQFSRFYSFDDLVPFKSQYEYCVYILDNVPSNIGIVVSTHPEYSVFSKEAVEFLKTKYSNFIYEDEFNSVYASGQFMLPFVDAVVTVSSSLALQTLLFDKKLITLSNKTFSFIADDINIKNIEKVLNYKNTNAKDSFLYFILTKYAITEEYIHNSKWLDGFLTGSIKKFRKNGILFNFYNFIDEEEKIFDLLAKKLQTNQVLVPHYLNKNFIQLLIIGLYKNYFIKLPVKDDSKTKKFKFNLSYYEEITKLRLDPLNESCIIKIDKIILKKCDGEEVDLTYSIDTNAIESFNGKYYFEREDGHIYFYNEFKDAKELLVWITYLKFEKEAQLECIKHLKRENLKEFISFSKLTILSLSLWVLQVLLRKLGKV